MEPLRDCECGMAKILHNVKQCSTCEVADRMADEIATLTRERDEAKAEVEKLRRALEEAIRALTVDPPYLSPARVGTARSVLAAALAGEGEGSVR